MNRGSAAVYGIAGTISAMAPALLFAIAAFSGLGPASATRMFAVPVILSSLIAAAVAVRLIRRGARRWGLVVAWTTIIASVVAYAAWINLALLGFSAGDGPL